jgi:hypothetical protein
VDSPVSPGIPATDPAAWLGCQVIGAIGDLKIQTESSHQLKSLWGKIMMQEYLDRALQYSRTLYQRGTMGTLVIQLDTQPPPGATALVTEHRPLEAQQYKLTFGGSAQVARKLPVGDYTVVVFAAGYQPFRKYTAVSAGQISTITASLRKNTSPPPPFTDMLNKYGVKRDAASIPNLTVQAGTTLVLDPKSPKLSLDIHYLELNTIDQVKNVLGHPDKHWAPEISRFGNLVPTKPSSDNFATMTPALRGAYREYVYGNSLSVSGWTSALNNWVKANPVNVGLWVYSDVYVGPGSVLQVGAEGLICNTLRVVDGTVQATGNGPVRVEMNTYEEYPPTFGGGGGGGGGGIGGGRPGGGPKPE